MDRTKLRLYAVTDRAWAADGDSFFRQVAAAVAGGADIVQLREKHLDPQAFLTEAKRFVALCREQGALSIINDSAEIAAQAGADGVHVGQGDLEASHARALLGPDKLIGVSAHTVEEALLAEKQWRRPCGLRRLAPTIWAWAPPLSPARRPTPLPSPEKPSEPSQPQ